MDPVTLATATITLIAPYLSKLAEKFAEKAGGAAWDKMTELYDALKHKFSADPHAQSALNDLEQAPGNIVNQEAVQEHLNKLLVADPEFGKQLAGLLEQAKQAGAHAVFNTEIHGKVDNLVNINVVQGDLNLGGGKPRG